MKKSQTQLMIPLITINQKMELQLHVEAIQIISKFTISQMTFVTFTGFKEYTSELSHSFMKSKINHQTFDGCLWMRAQPLYNQKINKYFFFLQCESWEPQLKEILHLVACSISYVNVVGVRDYDDFNYLGTVYDRIQEKREFMNVKYKMSQLICLMPSSEISISGLVQKTEQFASLLNERGIEEKVNILYPLVKCYGVSEEIFNKSSKQTEKTLMDEVQSTSIKSRDNSELMYGPIVAEFLKNIIIQLNSEKKTLDLEKAEYDIQIEPAYDAYVHGVQRYHQIAMGKLAGGEKLDFNEINDFLNESKNEAHEEYYRYNGAQNLKYKRLLDDYIQRKEEEIRSMYSQSSNNKNIQILEAESQEILTDLQRNKEKKEDMKYITEKLDNMTKIYEKEAQGPNKYQLLADYMKVFYPIVYGLNKDKEAELKKQEQKNKKLREEVEKLRKQNGEKCCSVM